MMQIFCFLSYFYLLILASIWTLACNNYYCGVCLRVIFYFLHSVYIYQLEFECNKSHPFSFIYLFNYLFILLCTIDYNPIYQLCHCWHWPRFGHQNSSSCSLMFSPFSSISFHFGSTRYSRIVSYFSYIDLGIHSSSKSSFFFFSVGGKYLERCESYIFSLLLNYNCFLGFLSGHTWTIYVCKLTYAYRHICIYFYIYSYLYKNWQNTFGSNLLP